MSTTFTCSKGYISCINFMDTGSYKITNPEYIYFVSLAVAEWWEPLWMEVTSKEEWNENTTLSEEIRCRQVGSRSLPY